MGIKCKFSFDIYFYLYNNNQKKVINSNDIFPIDVNSVNNNNEDYCTIIQSSGGNPSSFGIYAHRCDDGSIKGYPLCRLLRNIYFYFIEYSFFSFSIV